MLAWVLDTTTNQPVAGASLTVFARSCYSSCTSSQISSRGGPTTDMNGLATVTPSAYAQSSSYTALLVEATVATSTGVDHLEPLLIDGLPYSSSYMETGRLTGRLLADRSLYSELDVVYLKGYLRQASGASVILPRSSSLQCVARVRWTSGAEETTAEVDGAGGACNLTMTVPAGADYGEHLLSLYARDLSNPRAPRNSYVHSMTLVVADPRPPTVQWAVEAEGVRVLTPWRPADGTDVPTVGIRIVTSTLSGVPLPSATIRLVWTLRRDGVSSLLGRLPCGLSETAVLGTDEENGEEWIITGDDGTLSLAWSPPNLTAGLRIGGSVDLAFEWVGPTRERLTADLTVPIAHREHTLSLSASRQSELPLHPFTLSASLQLHDALGGGHVAATLRFALYALDETSGGVNEDSGEHPSHAESWLKDGLFDQLPPEANRVGSVCHVPSYGTGPVVSHACHFELPAVGRYVASVCELGADEQPLLCTATLVGRSEAEWDSKPLASYLDIALEPSFDCATYSVGDTAVLRFHNPLETPMQALVLWGNELGQRAPVLATVDPGAAQIALPTTQECVGGCGVLLSLAAKADPDRTLPVPASPLLDATNPMLATFDLRLDVVPASSGELQLTIAPNVTVATPGSTAGFTISVSNLQGEPVAAEVAVFVVDRAILQLREHAVHNLTKTFEQRLGGLSYQTKSSYQSLRSVSRSTAMRNTRATTHLPLTCVPTTHPSLHGPPNLNLYSPPNAVRFRNVHACPSCMHPNACTH